jgi:hypothetical protein
VILSGIRHVDFFANANNHRRMLELLIVIGRGLALALYGHRELVLENLALRQPLMAVKRTTKRASLETRDRLFWITFVRVWRNYTEWRNICYPWHPWFGRTVAVYEVFIKGGQSLCRCVSKRNGMVEA